MDLKKLKEYLEVLQWYLKDLVKERSNKIKAGDYEKMDIYDAQVEDTKEEIKHVKKKINEN